MIKYKLICKNCNNIFDSWFSNSKEYEKLKKRKYLNCHICDSQKIEKALIDNRTKNPRDTTELLHLALKDDFNRLIASATKETDKSLKREDCMQLLNKKSNS